MKTIAEVAGHELHWKQGERLKAVYELHAGTDLLGMIDFQRSTLATAEAEGFAWTFKREGFWRQRVTVRPVGSDANVAEFRPHLGGGGELSTTNGTTFHLGASNFWHSEWQWRRADEQLVAFRPRSGALKTEGSVVVAPAAVQLAELPLLVLLGWYLILLEARDVAVAGASATVASRVVVMQA